MLSHHLREKDSVSLARNTFFPIYSPEKTGTGPLIGDKSMIMVKKRDGRKEPFVVEKIVVSAIKSGASLDIARTIASDIEKNATDGITTKELKNRVLRILKAKNPQWERNWMVFDTAVKKRTE